MPLPAANPAPPAAVSALVPVIPAGENIRAGKMRRLQRRALPQPAAVVAVIAGEAVGADRMRRAAPAVVAPRLCAVLAAVARAVFGVVEAGVVVVALAE